MFRPYMKCNRVRRLISDGIDEPLSVRDEAKVQAHLAVCPDCRRELSFYNRIKKTASKLEAKTPPAYLWERISLELDEHPWGDEPDHDAGFWKKFLPGWGGFQEINLSSAVVSFLLIAFLCLFPGLDSINDEASPPTLAQASEYEADLSYLSLYMMANNDIFPNQVQEYYLAQFRALDGKIRMIKSALDRFPDNRRIRAQLALAYGHKLALYNRIGLTENNRLPAPDERYDYSRRGDIYD